MKRFLCGPSLVVLAAFVAASVSGCAGTRAAYQSAATLDETALVVSEHYYALLREANDLADQGAGDAFIDRVQALEARTTPAVLALRDAAEAYETIASADTESRLQTALTVAVPLVSEFVNVVRAAR